MLNHLVLSAAETHNTMISNMIVVTGSFVILLVLLKIFAWDSVAAMLKKREDQISNDIDSAEKARIEATKLAEERAEQLTKSRVEAADIIKSAKDTGEATRQTMVNDAKQEVSELKDKAHSDIALERQAALASIQGEVADLSVQIAEKILRKELSEDSHQALIDQYIDGLGTLDETR